jgi:hypothetical protein
MIWPKSYLLDGRLQLARGPTEGGSRMLRPILWVQICSHYCSRVTFRIPYPVSVYASWETNRIDNLRLSDTWSELSVVAVWLFSAGRAAGEGSAQESRMPYDDREICNVATSFEVIKPIIHVLVFSWHLLEKEEKIVTYFRSNPRNRPSTHRPLFTHREYNYFIVSGTRRS